MKTENRWSPCWRQCDETLCSPWPLSVALVRPLLSNGSKPETWLCCSGKTVARFRRPSIACQVKYRPGQFEHRWCTWMDRSPTNSWRWESFDSCLSQVTSPRYSQTVFSCCSQSDQPRMVEWDAVKSQILRYALPEALVHSRWWPGCVADMCFFFHMRRLLVVQFMSSHAEQIMRLQTLKDRVMIHNEVEHSQRLTHAHTRHSASCLLWCTLCPRTLKGWLNVIRFIMRTYENPQDVIFLGGLFYIWHSTALI